MTRIIEIQNQITSLQEDLTIQIKSIDDKLQAEITNINHLDSVQKTNPPRGSRIPLLINEANRDKNNLRTVTNSQILELEEQLAQEKEDQRIALEELRQQELTKTTADAIGPGNNIVNPLLIALVIGAGVYAFRGSKKK